MDKETNDYSDYEIDYMRYNSRFYCDSIELPNGEYYHPTLEELLESWDNWEHSHLEYGMLNDEDLF